MCARCSAPRAERAAGNRDSDNIFGCDTRRCEEADPAWRARSRERLGTGCDVVTSRGHWGGDVTSSLRNRKRSKRSAAIGSMAALGDKRLSQQKAMRLKLHQCLWQGGLSSVHHAIPNATALRTT